MTDTAPGRSRRRLIAVAAAVVVVAAAAIVILTVGGLRYPEFDPLSASPDPAIEGTVAFTRHRGGDACLFLVPAGGGAPRSLRCGDPWYGPLTWTEQGDLVTDAGGDRLRLDPSTGEVLSREPLARVTPLPEPVDGPRDDGALVRTTSTTGQARVLLAGQDGGEQVVVDVQGPRDYAFVDARWSPDGRWILVYDSARRLLVADPADGGARLLVEDADGPGVWYQP